MNKQKAIHKGRAFLLTGKVSSGKTTYVRKQVAQGHAVFLSLDELQLSVFGPSPTREQLDSSFDGARSYQFKEAMKFLEHGIDVYLDWGLWSREERLTYRRKLEGLGIQTDILYFRVPIETRLQWNAKRNKGNDEASYKIAEHDLELFDSLYEEPSVDEYDRLIEPEDSRVAKD